MSPAILKVSVIMLVMLGVVGETAIVAQQAAASGELSPSIIIPAVVVFAAIGGLASLVWRMLSARIDRIERAVESHQERMRDLDRLSSAVAAMRKNLMLIPQIHSKLHGLDDSVFNQPAIKDE